VLISVISVSFRMVKSDMGTRGNLESLENSLALGRSFPSHCVCIYACEFIITNVIFLKIYIRKRLTFSCSRDA
jgi:hypothetical protein